MSTIDTQAGNRYPVRLHPAGVPVMDVAHLGLLYTIHGTPCARPDTADTWEIVSAEGVTCLFEWQQREHYRGFQSHPGGW